MYFLNLTLGQFLMLFGSISALAVALYLLDRSRRRQVVSTLRFWVAAEEPAMAARRRRIQQPWSLVLQLAGMALLLLAVSQLRFGTQAMAPRDHVIILDSSAWMGARSGNRTLMDIARDRARAYLRAVPAGDRVMLVRADALTTPATAFEPERRKVAAAIAATQPGTTALNLDQALAFARRVQQQGGRRIGEIAFVGTGRTAEREAGVDPQPIHNLRFIPVPDTVENCGLRKVGLRRSNKDADLWEIYVAAHNYGVLPRSANLAVNFGPPGPSPAKTAVGTRKLTLAAGGDAEASFAFRTRAAGALDVMLTPHDAFPADDFAELELPAQPSLNVTVYSSEPDLLRPVLSANTRVNAVYRKPAEYRDADGGLVILDRFIPTRRPASDSIWIDPPAQGSPVPVRTRVSGVPFGHWNTGHPTSEGLRTKDFRLDSASVFEAGADDVAVGEVAAGPVVVARTAKPKIAVIGFHPVLSAMRYELATPLLFANLIRWTSPEIFRRWELTGGSVGTVRLALEDPVATAVKVTQQDGSPVPFTLRDRTLDFFSGTPGSVRVLAGDREYVYSLTLPQLWEARWDAPASARHGIPRAGTIRNASLELWPWLALAGALCLLAEWLLYGRFRRMGRMAAGTLSLRRTARAAGVSR